MGRSESRFQTARLASDTFRFLVSRSEEIVVVGIRSNATFLDGRAPRETSSLRNISEARAAWGLRSAPPARRAGDWCHNTSLCRINRRQGLRDESPLHKSPRETFSHRGLRALCCPGGRVASELCAWLSPSERACRVCQLSLFRSPQVPPLPPGCGPVALQLPSAAGPGPAIPHTARRQLAPNTGGPRIPPWRGPISHEEQ